MNLIKSIRWSFLDQLVSQGILILFNIFFTRNLLVTDIGLWAILSSVNGISIIILDAGFSAALIQANSVTKSHYKAVFVVNFIISFIIYLLCIFLANTFATSLGIIDSNFQKYFQLYSVGIILNGLISVPKIILMRELEFKKLALVNLFATLVSVGIGVALITKGYKFISLIYQFLFSLLIQFIFYIYFNSAFLKEKFILKPIFNLFRYGNRLFISALLDNIYSSIYNFFLAKNFSLTSLGYFNRAKYLHDIPNNAFSLIFLRVLFPFYAKAHNSEDKLFATHKILIKLTLFFIAIPVFLVVLFSRELVDVIFGKNFSIVSIILPIIIINIPFYILDSLNLTLIKSIGRSDLFLKIEFKKKIIVLLLVVIAVLFKNIFLLYIIFPVGGFISLLLGINVIKDIYHEKIFIRSTIFVLLLMSVISITCFFIINYFKINFWYKLILLSIVIGVFLYFFSKIFTDFNKPKNIFTLVKRFFK